MFKLLLAALLMISGSILLIFSARSFKSIKANLALVLTSFLFLGQGTLMISQVRVKGSELARAAEPSPPPEATPVMSAWDQGGTLGQANLGQWRLGEYANRLASAAALIRVLRQERVFVASIRSEQEYRPWAAALVACLEASSAGDETPIPALARQCAQNNGLKPFL